MEDERTHDSCKIKFPLNFSGEPYIPITVSQLTKQVRTTIGTPFHHGGRVNQVGLDCGGMMIVALQQLGYTLYDKPHYNRGDGLADMVEILSANSFSQRNNGSPKPGDVVLIRSSNIYHHLVYYTEDHTIIHGWVTSGLNKVVETTMLPEWQENIHSIWRFKDLE